MKTIARPAALIFDLDGTLVDTEPLYSIATQKVLDTWNAKYTAELKQRCMGGPARTTAQIVIEACGLPISPEEYLARRETHLRTLFRECAEIPGAGEFVAAAHRLGLPLGLATSSHRHLKDLKLLGKSWADCFSASICGDHPRLQHGKPAPDIFLLAADALGVASAQCVVFEDSRNGVEAGRAAGMTVVALNNAHVAPDDLAAADFAVDGFDQAMALLDRWR